MVAATRQVDTILLGVFPVVNWCVSSWSARFPSPLFCPLMKTEQVFPRGGVLCALSLRLCLGRLVTAQSAEGSSLPHVIVCLSPPLRADGHMINLLRSQPPDDLCLWWCGSCELAEKETLILRSGQHTLAGWYVNMINSLSKCSVLCFFSFGNDTAII